jgi:uncharacterized membrane protein YeaQ/YmgE (transglycosylase-associated protein family)
VGPLSWLILGLIVGFAASLLTRSDRYGLIGNTIAGISGALLGGWVATALLMIDLTGIGLTSIAISVAGAIVMIFLYRNVMSGTRRMQFRY